MEKELYEVIGMLFVENRRCQNISEQLQKMLEEKIKENNLLQEKLKDAPKSEV